MPVEVTCAGEMIERNPGVSALWTTTSYKVFNAGDGVLFEMGEPEQIAWYAEGRQATRAEVMASLESGYPLLRELADQEGPMAVASLDEKLVRALRLVPKQ
jgi:protein-disulfide isomerase-like protein with CxxC motif